MFLVNQTYVLIVAQKVVAASRMTAATTFCCHSAWRHHCTPSSVTLPKSLLNSRGCGCDTKPDDGFQRVMPIPRKIARTTSLTEEGHFRAHPLPHKMR